MRIYFTVVIAFTILFGASKTAFSQTKTVHILVALFDNASQSAVPVSMELGNGFDPSKNLYWGGKQGVKSVFDNAIDDWVFVTEMPCNKNPVLQRLLYKHKSKDIYLLADAFNGNEIRKCSYYLLYYLNGQHELNLQHEGRTLSFGGGSDLVAYIGQNGLKDFKLDVCYNTLQNNQHKAIILSPDSREHFWMELRKAGAFPLIWTRMLMRPDAFTLKAIIDGWLKEETGDAIKERAISMYNKIQRCGIQRARNIFATGMSDGH